MIYVRLVGKGPYRPDCSSRNTDVFNTYSVSRTTRLQFRILFSDALSLAPLVFLTILFMFLFCLPHSIW